MSKRRTQARASTGRKGRAPTQVDVELTWAEPNPESDRAWGSFIGFVVEQQVKSVREKHGEAGVHALKKYIDDGTIDPFLLLGVGPAPSSEAHERQQPDGRDDRSLRFQDHAIDDVPAASCCDQAAPLARSRAMANKQKQHAGSDLDEVLEVFGRAKQLYPRLLKQREYHAVELQKLDAALERLKQVVGVEEPALAASATKAKQTNGKARRIQRSRTANGGAPKVANLVLSALSSAKRPLNAAELRSTIGSERDVSKANLQNVLRDLRSKGLVKATGKAKRFSYSIGKAAPRAADAATTARAKPKGRKPKPSAKRATSPKVRGRAAKKASKGAGARTLREIILGVLAADAPRSYGEIVAAVEKERPDAQKRSVAPTLTQLRKAGLVKVTGEPREFRYTPG